MLNKYSICFCPWFSFGKDHSMSSKILLALGVVLAISALGKKIYKFSVVSKLTTSFQITAYIFHRGVGTGGTRPPKFCQVPFFREQSALFWDDHLPKLMALNWLIKIQKILYFVIPVLVFSNLVPRLFPHVKETLTCPTKNRLPNARSDCRIAWCFVQISYLTFLSNVPKENLFPAQNKNFQSGWVLV